MNLKLKLKLNWIKSRENAEKEHNLYILYRPPICIIHDTHLPKNNKGKILC